MGAPAGGDTPMFMPSIIWLIELEGEPVISSGRKKDTGAECATSSMLFGSGDALWPSIGIASGPDRAMWISSSEACSPAPFGLSCLALRIFSNVDCRMANTDSRCSVGILASSSSVRDSKRTTFRICVSCSSCAGPCSFAARMHATSARMHWRVSSSADEDGGGVCPCSGCAQPDAYPAIGDTDYVPMWERGADSKRFGTRQDSFVLVNEIHLPCGGMP